MVKDRLLVTAVGAVTPEELAEVTRHRHPDVTVNATPATWAADDEVWLINGRWLGLAEREAVLSLAAGHKLVDREQTLVAAKIRWSSEEQQTLSAAALHARAAKLPAVQLDASLLIARPWHILDALPALVMDDLLASPLPQVLGASPWAPRREMSKYPYMRLPAISVAAARGGLKLCRLSKLTLDVSCRPIDRPRGAPRPRQKTGASLTKVHRGWRWMPLHKEHSHLDVQRALWYLYPPDRPKKK